MEIIVDDVKITFNYKKYKNLPIKVRINGIDISIENYQPEINNNKTNQKSKNKNYEIVSPDLPESPRSPLKIRPIKQKLRNYKKPALNICPVNCALKNDRNTNFDTLQSFFKINFNTEFIWNEDDIYESIFELTKIQDENDVIDFFKKITTCPSHYKNFWKSFYKNRTHKL